MATSAAYAGYPIINRSLVEHYSPFTLTTYAASIAAIPILAVTAPTLNSQDWGAITGFGWLAMTWVIIGPVFVAWSAWSWVQRQLTATQIAPLLFLVPVVSGLTAWIVLDENISIGQLIGTAVVIGGLVLNSRAAKTQT
ncbi:MAG: O-acetylserine/cysteine efflux transporter [Candidatus Poriferisodalaceae bacterium]